MTIDWSPLRRELAQWRSAGMVLPLWWRDDDAVTATPALAQLATLSRDLDLPVHLAVIPAFADETLAAQVADAPLLIPTVHGWAHENHAPAGQKKAEFGHPRPGIAEALARGRSRLDTLFGPRSLPAFVAPWNRLHPDVLPALAQTGYRILSTFTPRARPHPHSGLIQVNTHIDPIDWRGTRGLVDPAQIIAHTVRHLADRRKGVADNAEPMGYLTHHLVHSPDIWCFSRAFLAELLDGGARSTPLTHILEETE